jgi:hypothetical protein
MWCVYRRYLVGVLVGPEAPIPPPHHVSPQISVQPARRSEVPPPRRPGRVPIGLQVARATAARGTALYCPHSAFKGRARRRCGPWGCLTRELPPSWAAGAVAPRLEKLPRRGKIKESGRPEQQPQRHFWLRCCSGAVLRAEGHISNGGGCAACHPRGTVMPAITPASSVLRMPTAVALRQLEHCRWDQQGKQCWNHLEGK